MSLLTARFRERFEDVSLVSLVFGELLGRLARLGGQQTASVAFGGLRITSELGGSRTKNESQQMGGIRSENRIGLGAGDFRRAGDFRDASEIVAEIRVEGTEGLVDRQCHRGEELHAIGLTLGAESHHAIVQSISAFAW